MFIKVSKRLFTNNNVTILNNKVISIIPIYNPDKNIMIVQQNATKLIIN